MFFSWSFQLACGKWRTSPNLRESCFQSFWVQSRVWELAVSSQVWNLQCSFAEIAVGCPWYLSCLAFCWTLFYAFAETLRNFGSAFDILTKPFSCQFASLSATFILRTSFKGRSNSERADSQLERLFVVSGVRYCNFWPPRYGLDSPSPLCELLQDEF
jgi:hypothetical protein